MEIILCFVAVAVIAYFIGTINFAKIVAWHARRKDITKIGSKNPGTMNMLRSFGFWLALITFLCEVLKAGAICLITKVLFYHFGFGAYGELAYYIAGLFLILGYDFPVWSKFKGGKGVACMAGIFLFTNLWYVGIGWFVLCFVMLVLLDYGCVVSFTYIGGLSIANTIFVWFEGVAYMGNTFAWIVTAIIWFLFALMIFKHRGNIRRLINHTENKVGFKAKLSKIFKKGESEESQKTEEKDVKETEKQNDQTENNTTQNEEDEILS